MEVYEQLTVTSLLMLFKDKIVMLKKTSLHNTKQTHTMSLIQGKGRGGGGEGVGGVLVKMAFTWTLQVVKLTISFRCTYMY